MEIPQYLIREVLGGGNVLVWNIHFGWTSLSTHTHTDTTLVKQQAVPRSSDLRTREKNTLTGHDSRQTGFSKTSDFDAVLPRFLYFMVDAELVQHNTVPKSI